MMFKEYVRVERKKKFVSVKQFVKETGIELSESSYYAIEKGNYNPSPKDVYKIIQALKLPVRDTFIMWLRDQLPEKSLRNYFHVATMDSGKREEVKKYNPDEIITVSKSHIDYLVEHRLARLLLAFIFMNSSADLSIDYIKSEFKKHSLTNIKKYLKKLLAMGYIAETKTDHYRANARYLYHPQNKDFEKLHEINMVDIIKTANFNNELETEYGKYSRGMRHFHRRTLTPAQLDYLLDIFKHAYNESVGLKNEPGQEYCIAITIGAFYEK